MVRRSALAALVVALSGMTGGGAHAALQGRDLDGDHATFEAWYDTGLDITWLADANYAQTSGFDSDGLMKWDHALIWAEDLDPYGSGITGWRLPTTLQPDSSCGWQSPWASSGPGCVGSEMGHLFYHELGGVAGASVLASIDPDLAKFTNIQPDRYRSSSEYTGDVSYAHSWVFNMNSGYQSYYYKDAGVYAWAVHDGSVGAVPEAESWALMLAGVMLVAAAARRRT